MELAPVPSAASACGAGQRGRFTMARVPTIGAGVLAILLIAGCEEPLLILGPTPPDEGIILYMHAGFAGPSQALNVDVRDLRNVEGPCSSGAEGEVPTWDECVSSVRVLPGWSATFYNDDDFKGRSLRITADVPNLHDLPGPCDDDSFNDCVRSIRVVRQ